MSDGKTPPIVSLGTNDVDRVKATNQRLKQMIEETQPPGVGYIVVSFETPMSLLRGQVVAMATDHDAKTIEYILSGILRGLQKRV